MVQVTTPYSSAPFQCARTPPKRTLLDARAFLATHLIKSQRQLVGDAMNSNNGAFRILVVDNDPAIATSLAEILQSSGFSALPFSNPFNALAATAAEYPDVLITAVQIADISGIELALQLKDLCLDCGVLIISGFSCFGNLIERACRLGFQISLHSRPANPNTFPGEVRRLVHRNTLSANRSRSTRSRHVLDLEGTHSIHSLRQSRWHVSFRLYGLLRHCEFQAARRGPHRARTEAHLRALDVRNPKTRRKESSISSESSD